MVVKNECWTLNWERSFDGGVVGNGLRMQLYNGRLFIGTHPTAQDRVVNLSFPMLAELVHDDLPLRAVEGLIQFKTGLGAQIDELEYNHLNAAGSVRHLLEVAGPITSPTMAVLRYPIGTWEFGDPVLSTVVVEMKIRLLAAFPAEDREVEIAGVGLTTTYDQP